MSLETFQSAKRNLSHTLWLKRLQFRLRGLMANESRSKGRPLVVGFMSARSGLGEGARLIYKGLEDIGAEPSYVDITPLFPGHEEVIDLPTPRNDDGTGPILFHVNAPELLMVIEQAAILNLGSRYRVGIWAWEQERTPATWTALTKWIDEVWASSIFLYRIFQSSFNISVSYVPYPCAGLFKSEKAAERLEGAPFKVLAAFDPKSSIDRKNPVGALSAFQDAFPKKRTGSPPATLTYQVSGRLDTNVRQILERDPRICILEQALSSGDLVKLICEHDVFITLPRAEGFGLSIAKSLVLGVPTIFPNHSGARDFVGAPLAFPVGHGTTLPTGKEFPYNPRFGCWAEPDIAEASKKLVQIQNLSSEELEVGRQASAAWWQMHFGADKFARQVTDSPIRFRLGI